MPVTSVTRFRLRSPHPVGLALFFWHTLASARQSEATPGFLGGRLFRDAKLTFWTVTLWEDEAAMRRFRNAGRHLRAMQAMQRLASFCSEAAVVSWPSLTAELPTPEELYRRLVDEGRFYTLSRPSRAHMHRSLDAPRLREGQVLRPRTPKAPASPERAS